jgi:Family of unknown function (DUF6152)
MRRIAVLLAAVFLPPGAMAHHSRAEYTQAPLEIEGKLVAVVWRNPHPAFTVETKDGNGRAVTWDVEGWSALYTFERAGISRDRFKEGDHIRVLGLPSGLRPGRMLAMNILLADGTEAVLKRDADPYFGKARHLGGRELWEKDTHAAVVDAKAENRGLFRVWSYPAPAYQTTEHVSLTATAQAARAKFDEVENFIIACGQKSMPGSMLTPNPYELIDHGATITIRGYEGDVVRTVHMSVGAKPPATRERQGFSVGHWENDRTLVIRTTEIAAPHLGFSGVPLDDGAIVEERYALSEDQARLDFKITVTDPKTFTEPATFEYYWLALGESFGRYDCDVH